MLERIEKSTREEKCAIAPAGLERKGEGKRRGTQRKIRPERGVCLFASCFGFAEQVHSVTQRIPAPAQESIAILTHFVKNLDSVWIGRVLAGPLFRGMPLEAFVAVPFRGFRGTSEQGDQSFCYSIRDIRGMAAELVGA